MQQSYHDNLISYDRTNDLTNLLERHNERYHCYSFSWFCFLQLPPTLFSPLLMYGKSKSG